MKKSGLQIPGFSFVSGMWSYVYILKLNSGKHYVGCTSDVKARILRKGKSYKGFLIKENEITLRVNK